MTNVPSQLESLQVFNVKISSKILGISCKTLYAWIRSGIIHQYHKLPSGKLGFTADDLQKCIEKVKLDQKLDIHQELQRPRRRYVSKSEDGGGE